MSHLNLIHGALERFFSEEGLCIVFWNDPDQEFFMTVTLLGQKVEGRHNPGPASVMPAPANVTTLAWIFFDGTLLKTQIRITIASLPRRRD